VQAAAEAFQEIVRNLTASPGPGAGPGAVHPALRALHLVWPSLDACLTVYASSSDVLEKVCKCYKVVIRAAKTHFMHSLNDMIA
jgi:hypothetical protein